jgi:hypothetical protein
MVLGVFVSIDIFHRVRRYIESSLRRAEGKRPGSNETYLYFFANTSQKTFTFQDANGKISKDYEGGKMDGFV